MALQFISLSNGCPIISYRSCVHYVPCALWDNIQCRNENLYIRRCERRAEKKPAKLKMAAGASQQRSHGDQLSSLATFNRPLYHLFKTHLAPTPPIPTHLTEPNYIWYSWLTPSWVKGRSAFQRSMGGLWGAAGLRRKQQHAGWWLWVASTLHRIRGLNILIHKDLHAASEKLTSWEVKCKTVSCSLHI